MQGNIGSMQVEKTPGEGHSAGAAFGIKRALPSSLALVVTVHAIAMVFCIEVYNQLVACGSCF